MLQRHNITEDSDCDELDTGAYDHVWVNKLYVKDELNTKKGCSGEVPSIKSNLSMSFDDSFEPISRNKA